MKDGARIGRCSTVKCAMFTLVAQNLWKGRCARFFLHTVMTETGMNCNISGPFVYGRERELKKITGDQSLCYAEDPVTRQQHGVCGEKNSPQLKMLQF